MSRITKLLLLTLLVFGVGCQSQGYKPDPEEELRAKINMSNAASQMISVAEVNEVVDNGLLRVQIRFENRVQGRRSFRTLLEWFDAGGMKVDSANEVWNSHIIRAGQEFTVGGTATSPDVKDWRMQVVTWSR